MYTFKNNSHIIHCISVPNADPTQTIDFPKSASISINMDMVTAVDYQPHRFNNNNTTGAVEIYMAPKSIIFIGDDATRFFEAYQNYLLNMKRN